MVIKESIEICQKVGTKKFNLTRSLHILLMRKYLFSNIIRYFIHINVQSESECTGFIRMKETFPLDPETPDGGVTNTIQWMLGRNGYHCPAWRAIYIKCNLGLITNEEFRTLPRNVDLLLGKPKFG